MATGRQAFSGATGGMIIEAVLTRSPVPARNINPDIPPRLEEIINKALHKDREQRYQHAADIRADLQQLQRDTDSGTVSGWRTAERDAESALISTTSRLHSTGKQRTRNSTSQTGVLGRSGSRRSLTRLQFCLSKTPVATRSTNTSVTESRAVLSTFWRLSRNCG